MTKLELICKKCHSEVEISLGDNAACGDPECCGDYFEWKVLHCKKCNSKWSSY
jgi:hypothetical protein